MKPNLFVIGAMKCGTTSLHDYLSVHPQVVMSTVKEPEFFQEKASQQCPEVRDPDRSGHPSLESYLKLFPGADSKAYAGESSTWYTAWPHRQGIAERLHRFNPGARLVYIVRDPVERSISHYRFNCQMGWESGPPDQLLRRSVYWNFSNYAMQLRRYLRFFPREQIYTLTLEDLFAAPAATMGGLFRWLGLDLPPGHSDERYSERKNTTEELIQRESRFVARCRRFPAVALVRRAVPRRLRQLTRDLLNGRSIDRARVDMTVQIEFLKEMFIPHALELEDLCGRQFRQWRTLWGSGSNAGRLDLTPFQTIRPAANGAEVAPGIPAS